MWEVTDDGLYKHVVIVKEGDLLEFRENGRVEVVELEYGTDVDTGDKTDTLGFCKSKDGRLFLVSCRGKLINPDFKFKSTNPN